ncbi:sensor histidine kinase [Cohnella lupini]|uniref:Two-component system sensor histidine kinase YesM n=1 Tax=Cohnella lupini TaxID=1294267 RepID=A0A3D9HT48_9BACL|nr:histidine kinase [Cohnella lupini]RED52610.1 two-component system sensor histidine kinase YesM [Cohnella lupini]
MIRNLLPRRFTLFPKLIFAFMLVIAPLYILGLVINQMGESRIKSELSSSLQSRVSYYLSSLEAEKEHMQKLEQEMLSDKDLIAISVLSDIMPLHEWSERVMRVQSKLQLVLNSSVYIKNVSAHMLTVNRTLSIKNAISDKIEDDYEAVKPGEGIEYNDFQYWNDRLFLGLAYPDEIRNSRTMPNYVLSIELDIGQLRSTLRKFTDYDRSGAVLLGPGNGWAIDGAQDADKLAVLESFSANLAELGTKEGIEPIRMDGEKVLAAYRYSEKFGAYLFVYVPQDQVFGRIHTYGMLFWILSIVSVFIVVFYSYWLYRLIHMPLQKLIRSFRKVEAGEMAPVSLPKRGDEFHYLFQRFNQMVDNLQQLIHQVYEQKLRAKSSELKQLQSQINPHFLYNTYYILFRLAKMNENESVASFSRYLGEYFRYITRSKSSEVPLEAEAKHSKTYVEIQNVRFGNRIAVDFGPVPDDCKDIIVPKLIIQPILENAYQHGLENKKANGSIVVGFSRAGEVVAITVEDNGESLTDETLKKLTADLLDQKLDKEYTGLLNVHQRLFIMFGAEYGIKVSRGESGGLKVDLHIGTKRLGQTNELQSEE